MITDTLGQTRSADIHYQQHGTATHLIAIDTTDTLDAERHTAQTAHHLQTCLQQLEDTRRQLEQARQHQEAVTSALHTAREHERRRLAHHLHDGPLQQLPAILWQLEDLAADSPDAADTHTALTRFADQLRSQLTTLDPDHLGHRLPDALTRLADLHSHSTGPTVSYTTTSHTTPPIDDTTARSIYRSIDQAVANAVEHANATHITIIYTTTSHQLRWNVCDNGDGLDPNVDRQLDTAAHYGLRSLRTTTRTLGGTLEIRPSPTGGTCIEATIPHHP